MERLRKGLKICGIAGTQVRDVQGEILNIDGADITDLEIGRGRLNDNHSNTFATTLGRVNYAKKIFKEEDCKNDRQKYFYNKLKSPIIYFEGELFDSEDHPGAKATAAILKHIHKADVPLKIGASVEGGVLARGLIDNRVLEKTKVNAIALTFTPANRTTLVEPMDLKKSDMIEPLDVNLIKSIQHLISEDVPSFRYVYKDSLVKNIEEKINKINELLGKKTVVLNNPRDLMNKSYEQKIAKNIQEIQFMIKGMVAGYGYSGSPMSLTGGGVLQSESIDKNGLFDDITCDDCGTKQAYVKYQVKCRACNRPFNVERLYKKFIKDTK